MVTRAWEAHGGHVPPDTIPNLFDPFTRLLSTLLPHLEYVGVDDADPNNIRINFRPAGGTGTPFDIDHLSSGEKAAIALLLPLVERQSEQLVEPATTDPGVVPLTMLLDEPEIHLHPLLQIQVLQYLRDLAAEGVAQFILSTHSTALLDALTDEELYLVSPASLSPDNQLSRLTTSRERLEVARELTGSTHLLTRAKPVVFVEGEVERPGVSSDAKLLTMLLPQTASWALVPGRDKGSVRTAVQRLRQEGLELPGTPVFGIVDADRDDQTDQEHVMAWPVAMIENLLLAPDAIYEALEPVRRQTRATSVDAVRDALERATSGRVDDEVRLRIKQQLPTGRLEVPVDRLQEVQEVAAELTRKWIEKVAEIDLSELRRTAEAEVDQIVCDHQQLERFRGKQILQAVYGELRVADAQIGRSAFTLLIAATAAARSRAQQLAGQSVARIQLFFPRTLAQILRTASTSTAAEELAVRCEIEYAAWTAGSPSPTQRSQLRSEIFAFSRSLSNEQRQTIVSIASEIGTPE
ncbi:ATP-dependent nuclease [Micromonospora aurantiaca]|uniref:ATP-dependent nuclease n=1 Tax=Micromonospora aurantiaca (nom. illeg.) TaxID=47850 RepID=UPI0037AB7787